MTFTFVDKLHEIETEIAMRKRHYPAMIAKGALSETTAVRKIAILKAIADELRERVASAASAHDAHAERQQ